MTDVLASSLTNIVKFKIDFASYRKAHQMLDKLQKKMQFVNNAIAAPQMKVSKVKSSANAITDAHVKAYKDRRDLIQKEARDRTLVQKVLDKNEAAALKKQEQLSRARLSSTKVSNKALEREVARSQGALFKARFEQSVGITGRSKSMINARTSMFNTMPSGVQGPPRHLFEQRKAELAQQAVRNNRIDVATSRFDFNSGFNNRLKSSQVTAYRQQFEGLTAAYKKGYISLGQYNERLRQMYVLMRRNNAENKTFIERLRSIRSGYLLAGMTAGYAIASIAETGKKFQKTGMMMGAVFGKQSADELSYLREQSDRLGISFLDSATAYAKFSFAAKTANMSAEQTQEIFTGFSEAGKVFGLTTDEMNGTFKALEQMLS